MVDVLTGRFAVSQYTTRHQSFEEDVGLLARLDVDGIELCEGKLSSDVGLRRRQLDQVRSEGLRVVSVQPTVHAPFPDSISPQVTSLEKRRERYRQTIDWVASELGDERPPLVTVTGPAPGYDFAYARSYAVEVYRALADEAADAGLKLMVEPLSPVLMHTDTFICTLVDAVALVEEVGLANFGILVDVWHLWREYGIQEQLSGLGAKLFGVQVSDWPVGEPRALADRLIPGDGCINLGELFRAIESTGFMGPYSLEIFSDDSLEGSLWREDPVRVIERSRAGIVRALAEVTG